MKLLLRDVKGPIARVLNMSPDDCRVIEYINEAIEVMTLVNDWADMRRIMSLVAYNGYITFPPEIVVPLNFCINGQIGQPYGRHYEYLPLGPGDGGNWPFSSKNLVDAGETPTTYDIEIGSPSRLILSSDKEEKLPFSITLRGLDENGKEIRGEDGLIGEVITWTGEDDPIDGSEESKFKTTVNTFSSVTQVIKPLSSGYIMLSTIDEETGYPDFVLSHYHPGETAPSYRRFFLHGSTRKDIEGFTLIKGLFRIQAIPVRHDDDALAINLITALKYQVQALIQSENDMPNKAAINEGKAERLLTSQVNQYEVLDNTVDSDDVHGMNDVGL